MRHASGMEFQIYRLCDMPQFAAQLAEWDEAVWPRTPEIEEFFAVHYAEAGINRGSGIPQAWVAIADEKPVGMLSLVDHDHPEFLHITPCMVSAFVLPEYRRHGVFKALHDTLIEFAKTRMNLPHLYVYSTLNFPKMGWHEVQQTYDPFAPEKQTRIFRIDFLPSPSRE